MNNWLAYIRSGFSRKLPEDHVLRISGYQGLKSSVKKLLPFMARHWRRGLLALSILMVTALFSFPQPLITRYIVDEVILVLFYLEWRLAAMVAGVVPLLGLCIRTFRGRLYLLSPIVLLL